MERRLPDVHVQDSLYEVLKDIHSGKVKKEEVWVEFGKKEVRFTADGDGFDTSSTGFRASVSDAAKLLELHSPEEGLTLVRLGDQVIQLKELQRVTCASVFGSKLLVGNDRGKLSLIELNNPELNVDLEGHLFHTSVAKFFPSGEVCLSAGMDYTIKLWDIHSGRQIQALRHQKGLVEDVALISRGRNLFSLCPSDAKAGVALWEVGTPQVVHEYNVPKAQSIAIWAKAPTEETKSEGPFYGVDGNAGIVGTENEIMLIDVRQPKGTKLIDMGSSSVSVNSDCLVYANGRDAIGLDLRKPDQRLFTLSASTPVTQVVSTSSKTYIKSESESYGYAPRTGSVEVLCSSGTGVLTSHRDELWTVGNEARHFPL